MLPRGRCTLCNRVVALRRDGTTREHLNQRTADLAGRTCKASGQKPRVEKPLEIQRSRNSITVWRSEVEELVEGFLFLEHRRRPPKQGGEAALLANVRRDVKELLEDEAFIDQRDEAYGSGVKPRAFVADWFCVKASVIADVAELVDARRDRQLHKTASSSSSSTPAPKFDPWFSKCIALAKQHRVELDERTAREAFAQPKIPTPHAFVRWVAVQLELTASRTEPRTRRTPGVRPRGAMFAVEIPRTATVRAQRIRCGREGCTPCKNATGTGGHGPYWYAAWKENGRTRTKYLGRELARELIDQISDDDQRREQRALLEAKLRASAPAPASSSRKSYATPAASSSRGSPSRPRAR